MTHRQMARQYSGSSASCRARGIEVSTELSVAWVKWSEARWRMVALSRPLFPPEVVMDLAVVDPGQSGYFAHRDGTRSGFG